MCLGGVQKKNPIGIGFLIHDFIQFHVSIETDINMQVILFKGYKYVIYFFNEFRLFHILFSNGLNHFPIFVLRETDDD